MALLFACGKDEPSVVNYMMVDNKGYYNGGL